MERLGGEVRCRQQGAVPKSGFISTTVDGWHLHEDFPHWGHSTPPGHNWDGTVFGLHITPGVGGVGGVGGVDGVGGGGVGGGGVGGVGGPGFGDGSLHVSLVNSGGVLHILLIEIFISGCVTQLYVLFWFILHPHALLLDNNVYASESDIFTVGSIRLLHIGTSLSDLNLSLEVGTVNNSGLIFDKLLKQSVPTFEPFKSSNRIVPI